MPAYTYEAISAEGRSRQGVIDAESERAARSLLRQQALIPVKLQAVSVSKTAIKGDIVLWQARVFNRTDLVVWTRQLASLVAAGLPLERTLSALSEEADTPAKRDLLAQVRSEVNAGAPLAQALAIHPREFDALYVAVIGSVGCRKCCCNSPRTWKPATRCAPSSWPPRCTRPSSAVWHC